MGEVWLEGIRNPTAFAWDGQGRLYIATQGGDILRVNDAVNGEPPIDLVEIAGGIALVSVLRARQEVSLPVTVIRGIGPVRADYLQTIGIATVRDLLNRGRDPSGVRQIRYDV